MKEIALGILAGGKSSRMGQNKALLSVNGEKLLQHAVSCGKSFSQVLVSADTKERYAQEMLDLPKNVAFVYDELADFGPIEGIYQLLKETSCDYVLAVATDLPLLTDAFLEKWAERADGNYDCYVLTIDGGHLEPLCSIYGKKAIPVLEEMRREGLHRPRMLFDRVKTCYIEIEELGFSKKVISNVNTPEEFAAFLKGEA